jgi:hypothetical protein
LCRIVIGNINGHFETVFQKLTALHAKQNFSLAIIAGNLFQDPDLATNEDHEAVSKLVDGRIKVPLPTYFSLGKHTLPEKVTFKLDASGGEVCSNLFFLGRKTVTKTSEGIKIASLGGTLEAHGSGSDSSKDEFRPFYTEEDVKSLEQTKSADILITAEWPDAIRKGAKVEFAPGQHLTYSKPISELCTVLKPKYHFSVSPTNFYEREPFFHIQEESETFSITRFLSLAAFENPNKAKWIYAFSIDPTAAGPLSLAPGTTTSPFGGSKRAALPDQNSYRYSNDANYADSRPNKRRKHAKGPPPGPAECFFCLSNPNIATQLITSIGNDSYMTTAKGPLSTDSTFPTLEFPAHMLIIPLVHTPTLGLIPEEAVRASTEKEMQLYRKALNNMLKQNAPTLGSVTWEVSRAAGIHMHWQWLPISSDLIHRSLVEAAFKIEADNQKLPKFETNPSNNIEGDDYFKAAIWDPATGKDTSLVLPLDASFRFDMQFGRRVLAKLLELDNRADWKVCGQALEEEERDANRFKEAFKEFDFSLDE